MHTQAHISSNTHNPAAHKSFKKKHPPTHASSTNDDTCALSVVQNRPVKNQPCTKWCTKLCALHEAWGFTSEQPRETEPEDEEEEAEEPEAAAEVSL